jgi:enoyl-CoA hydratase/carnithine racemase
MDNLILTEQQNNVLTITLNRFDKKNALNTIMYQRLSELFLQANDDKNIHCVVIQGNDQCFCAGNDLQDFIASSESENLAAFDFIKILAEFQKPLIAAVAGPAVGIGTTLLLHCDMVFTTEKAKFKLPFTQLGLCPEAASSLLLSLRLGHNKAFELLVLGNTFNGQQAIDFGIANQLCDSNDLLTTAQQTALSIAKLPQDAVLTSRRLIKQASHSQVINTMNVEAQEFTRLVKTDTCKNILASFFK